MRLSNLARVLDGASTSYLLPLIMASLALQEKPSISSFEQRKTRCQICAEVKKKKSVAEKRKHMKTTTEGPFWL